MAGDKVDTARENSDSTLSQHPPPRPRVFVLSGIRLLRDGVVLALSKQSSIQVIGSADQTVPPRQIADLRPDALLLDMIVPCDRDISRCFREVMPEVKIIALGVAEVEQLVMACAGASVSGFIAPNGTVKDVVAAVHLAVRGELACSPRMAGMLLSRVRALVARPPSEPQNDILTRREREIASLLSAGMPNKTIASTLGIQNATVKNHVHNILSKMGVRRRGEAAAQLFGGRANGEVSLISPLQQTGRDLPYRAYRFGSNNSN